MPTDRKSIKVIERYSRELARQAVIGIDATLKNRWSRSSPTSSTPRCSSARARPPTRSDRHRQRHTDRRHLHPHIPRRHHIGPRLQRRRVDRADRTARSVDDRVRQRHRQPERRGPDTVTFASALAATAVDQITLGPPWDHHRLEPSEWRQPITGWSQTGRSTANARQPPRRDHPGLGRRSHPEPVVRQRHRFHRASEAQGGHRLQEVPARGRRHLWRRLTDCSASRSLSPTS